MTLCHSTVRARETARGSHAEAMGVAGRAARVLRRARAMRARGSAHVCRIATRKASRAGRMAAAGRAGHVRLGTGATGTGGASCREMHSLIRTKIEAQTISSVFSGMEEMRGDWRKCNERERLKGVKSKSDMILHERDKTQKDRWMEGDFEKSRLLSFMMWGFQEITSLLVSCTACTPFSSSPPSQPHSFVFSIAIFFLSPENHVFSSALNWPLFGVIVCVQSFYPY